MPKSFSRLQRVGDLIQTTLAKILQKEMRDLDIGMVTLTGVTVSPDMSHAKVFVSVLPEEKAKETIATLNAETKELRYLLAHSVKLRITPDLKFIYDDSILRGSRISSLIDSALKDNKSHDK